MLSFNVNLIDFNKLSSNKDNFIKFMNKNSIYPNSIIFLSKVTNIKYNKKNFLIL